VGARGCLAGDFEMYDFSKNRQSIKGGISLTLLIFAIFRDFAKIIFFWLIQQDAGEEWGDNTKK